MTLRRPARLRRFAAGGALLVGSLAAGLGLPAAGLATPRVPAPLPATLTLGSLTPVAPQPTDTVRLTGMLTNTSAFPLPHLALQLWFNPDHLTTRGVFDQYGDQSPDVEFTADGLVQRSDAVTRLPRDSLPAGGHERWTITVPVSDLQMQGWEVYRLGVAVSSAGTTVARLRTFLPYAPAGQPGAQPLSVSWVWPLVDRPHQNVVGTAERFTDDDLAGEVAAGGRLTSLLDAASTAAAQHPRVLHRGRGDPRRPAVPTQPAVQWRSVPTTLAIDPMLLAELSRMSSGYTVTGGGKTRPGTGKTAAAGFLDRLKSLVDSASGPTTVLPLPYADPDVVAAVRAHRTEQLATATSLGNSVLASTLGLDPNTAAGSHLLSGWAWPPDGYADRSVLDWLFSLGTQNVVLDSQALPTATVPESVPNAHVSVPVRDGQLTGVLADDTLSRVVAEGATTGSGLALQRYLAETLMIEAEAPSTPDRSIVVTAPRDWSPAAGYARRLLADTGRVPWIRPIPLTKAASGPITPAPARQLAYPRSEQRVELPTSYVQDIAQRIGEVNQLGAILQPGAAVVRAEDEAILQALSAAWRTDPVAAADYGRRLADQLHSTMHQVRIGTRSGSLITLTSHSGTVPITVFNGLDTPVRVGIRLNTLHRLSITGGQRVRQIPPHQRIAVDVRATANVSGSFPVKARLVTPGPRSRPYGTQIVDLFVRSTAYGVLALTITGVAFGVLLAAVVFRLARRALRARRAVPAG